MQNNKKDKNKDYDKNDAKSNSRAKKARKKVCPFCADKVTDIDYKEVAKLKKFTSERGKIHPRRFTGCCAKHQRQLTVAIKRARQIVLLAYVVN